MKPVEYPLCIIPGGHAAQVRPANARVSTACPRRPRPTHADAEQRADREQHRVRRREAAEDENNSAQNERHQRALPAPAIRRRAGADAADDPEEERDGPKRAGQRLVDGEAALNVGDKGNDRIVKSNPSRTSPERRP